MCTFCKHGTCGAQPHTCECDVGYFGRWCDKRVNPCRGGICENNGQCKFDSVEYSKSPDVLNIDALFTQNVVRCECPFGFTGQKCEIEISCQNGGELNETGTECVCQTGFDGRFCELESDEPASVLFGVFVGVVVVVLLLAVAIAAMICTPYFKSSKTPDLSIDDLEIAPAMTSDELPIREESEKTRIVREKRVYGHDRTLSTQPLQQQQPPSYHDVVGCQIAESSRGDSILLA